MKWHVLIGGNPDGNTTAKARANPIANRDHLRLARTNFTSKASIAIM
jgi:hypothetical protein